MDITELWRPLVYFQLIGILLLVGFAGIMGVREKRRINIEGNKGSKDSLIEDLTGSIELLGGRPRARDNKVIYLLNWLIFIGILITLLGGFMQASLAFLIGLVIVLPLNYKRVEDQSNIIKEGAPNAILMASIIISAGMFLGVLNGTGMLQAMAGGIVELLPDFVLSKLYIIVGILGLPFDLITSTDAYYFALLPIVLEISAPYGVDSTAVVYSMAIGNNFGAMISPLSPSTWLGIGLAGVSIGSHIRYSFFPMWIFSLVLLLLGYFLGLV